MRIYSFGIILIFILFSAPGYPAIINVPGDYPTIQQAIDASVNGDTILVAPGIYVENIDFKGKALIVRSDFDGDPNTHDISPQTTIIDGNRDGSVVKFVMGEKADSVIEGFSITNGSGTFVFNGTYGGGIFCRDRSSPTIKGNMIYGNEAFIGAGIAGYYFTSPIISNNIIADNKTEKNGYGGGIAVRVVSSPEIIGNTIIGNTAGYHGGGFYCSCSTASLANNIIARNEAWWGGALFFVGTGTTPEITCCTITKNRAGWSGGAIHCWYDVFPVVTNSILWNNDGQEGKEIYLGNHISPASGLTISYSLLEGGTSSVYLESGCFLDFDTNSMIDEAPLFEHPGEDDFHLSWLSPCINRGTNVGAPSDDIDGDVRPCMGTVDMGADEFTGIHTFVADVFSVSAASGGVVDFTLNGSLDNAGRNYLVLGSVAGTVPGYPLPGSFKTLPLNWDLFTESIIAFINTNVFTNFLDKLNSSGLSYAQLNSGPIRPEYTGTIMHYAYCLNKPWDFVSNPVAIEIVP